MTFFLGIFRNHVKRMKRFIMALDTQMDMKYFFFTLLYQWPMDHKLCIKFESYIQLEKSLKIIGVEKRLRRCNYIFEIFIRKIILWLTQSKGFDSSYLNKKKSLMYIKNLKILCFRKKKFYVNFCSKCSSMAFINRLDAIKLSHHKHTDTKASFFHANNFCHWNVI